MNKLLVLSRYFVSMCTLAFQIEPEHEWPLIVVANRDEFLARETKTMHWWPNSELLAGKDLQSGGTWGAVSKAGRFAMLTNFRDPKFFEREGPTRGALVVDAVKNSDYNIQEHPQKFWDRYNGFNLLWGDHKKVQVYNNVDHKLHELSQGVHGVSNAYLNTDWPKVCMLRGWLKDRVTSPVVDPLVFMDEALEVLADAKTYPLESLPNTGVPSEMEHKLSALRVQMDGYGSRLSTVYLRHRSGDWWVGERNFESGVRRVFRFSETDQ